MVSSTVSVASRNTLRAFWTVSSFLVVRFRFGIHHKRGTKRRNGQAVPNSNGPTTENWGASSTGNPLADWVTGRVTQLSQQQNAPVADFKYYQYSFYVNDQWKAMRRLTLTFGLRFEHMGNWY